ncbi:MAG: hypothetical protein ACPLPR_01525 [Bacillota bacterium]
MMILKEEQQPGPWLPLTMPWWGKWVRWGGDTPPGRGALCSWWLTAVLSGDPNAPPRYEIQRDEEGHVVAVIPLGTGAVGGPQVYVVPSRGMIHAWYQGLAVTVGRRWRWEALEFPLLYATPLTPLDHVKAQAAIWLWRQRDKCPPEVGEKAQTSLYQWLRDFIGKVGGDPERVSEIWGRLLTRYFPTTHSPASYVRAACQRAHTMRNMLGELPEDKRRIPGDRVAIISPHGSRVGQVAAEAGVHVTTLYRCLRANVNKLPPECRVVRRIQEGTVTVLRERFRYGAVPVGLVWEMAEQLKEKRAARSQRARRVHDLAETCGVSIRTAQRWLKESAGDEKKVAELVARALGRNGNLSLRLHRQLLGTAPRMCSCGCGRSVPVGRKYATDACKQRAKNASPYKKLLAYLNTQRRRGRLTEEECKKGHTLAKQLRVQHNDYESLKKAVLEQLRKGF